MIKAIAILFIVCLLGCGPDGVRPKMEHYEIKVAVLYEGGIRDTVTMFCSWVRPLSVGMSTGRRRRESYLYLTGHDSYYQQFASNVLSYNVIENKKR